MIDDLVEQLDRERDYLIALEGPDFLRQLDAYLTELRRDPRSAAIVDELVGEAGRLEASYDEQDRNLVPQVMSLRREFLRLVPDGDDSGQQAPEASAFARGAAEWLDSLGHFDQVAARPPMRVSLQTHAADNRTRSATMLGILQRRIRSLQFPETEQADGLIQVAMENQRSDLDALRLEVDQLRAEQQQLHQKVATELSISPGFAFVELQAVVTDAISSGGPRPEDETELAAWAPRMLDTDVRALYTEALFGTGAQGLTPRAADQLATLIGRHKRLVERLHNGVRSRAHRRRSSLHLLKRYRTWAQLYDADRLRELADAKSDQAERCLAAEAAKFFFGQGLTPLTEMNVGNVRPDIIDAFSGEILYIEAKQLHGLEKGPTKRKIRDGAHQIYNTLGRIQPVLPVPVHEAFLLVFRRDGPDVDLPPSYPAGDVTVYPVYIDIGPPSASGSRQKHQAIRISTEDLAPPAR